MCDICKASGYEIQARCPVCGFDGADVGVYLDGSGCWQCSPESGDLTPARLHDVLSAWDRLSNLQVVGTTPPYYGPGMNRAARRSARRRRAS